MRLNNDIYNIVAETKHIDATSNVSNASFDISLNASHTIFKAHFPGKPITPGVIIIEIAKELVEKLFGKTLLISEVKNVKFLSVLSPKEHQHVTYNITKCVNENGSYISQISVVDKDVTFAKISFTCIEA